MIIEDDTDAASVPEAYLKRDNVEVVMVGTGLGALRVLPCGNPISFFCM